MLRKIGMLWLWVVEEEEILDGFSQFTMINIYLESIGKLDRLNNDIVVRNKA